VRMRVAHEPPEPGRDQVRQGATCGVNVEDPFPAERVVRVVSRENQQKAGEAMSNERYHESVDSLDETSRDMHRALVSLMEELEAVDWYQQRVVATDDEELRRILAHNRDEEKEHAAMVLEWLRRHDAQLDTQLRAVIFSDGEVTAIGEHTAPESRADDGSLGIGSLHSRENEA
jgi:ferritin-like protein